MRQAASFGIVLGLAGCGVEPKPEVWEPPTREEFQAFINSPEFQSWVIYDCDFEPDAAAARQGAAPLRQLIYDEDGSAGVLYCEPSAGHTLACFDRSVRGTTEVFDLREYKAITIEADGAARMTVYDRQYDPETHEVTAITEQEFSGSCRRGAAYPSGVYVPDP